MNRRKFNQLALGASILATSGFFRYTPYTDPEPTRQSEGNRNTARNIFTCPAAIEPVTGYLARSRLSPSLPLPASFEAIYYLINWGAIAKKTGLPHNYIVGRLEITRHLTRDHVLYQVNEMRSRGTDRPLYELTTRYWCTIESEHVFRWALTFRSLDSMGKPITIADYMENGTVTYTPKARVKITSSAGRVIREFDHPIIHQASLINLMTHSAIAEGFQFSMAHEGMSIRQGQTLHGEGILNISAGGVAYSLDSYRQTGPGITPIHYLVDPDLGIAHLITKEEVNYALWTCSAIT